MSLARNIEAENRYRAAFRKWADSVDESERLTLEREMDATQSSIADNPADPRWIAFKETLPELDQAFGRMIEIAARDMTIRSRG